MAEFDLQIVLDDRRLFKSLDDTERKLEDIDKEAQRTGQTMSKAFNTADSSVNKLNSDLSKTEKRLERTSKTATSTGSRIRRVRRDILAAFTGAGILGAFGQIEGAIEGVSEAVSKYRFENDAAFAVNKRLADITKDVSAEFVNEQAKVSALFGAIKQTTDQSEKETQGKIDKKAAIQAINEQYGEYLPNLLTENSTLEEIEKAQKAVNAAVIERIALSARQQALSQIATEIFELSRLEEAYKNVDQTQKENVETLGELFNLFGTPAVGQAFDIDEQVAQRREKLQNEIDLLGQSSENFSNNLSAAFESLGDEFFQQIGTTEDFVNSTNNATKSISQQRKEVELIDGSLARYRAELAEVNKQLDQVEGTAENLAPLVKRQEELNTAIQEQIQLRENLKTVTDEQIQEQIRLVEQAFLTEEDRAINATIRASQERQKEIEALRVDDAIKNDLLKKNQELLNSDLSAINQKFRDEEVNAELQAAQQQLEQQIRLQEADLKAAQAGQLLRVQQSGATEEELTAIQAEQEKQRQMLALETEKKRLELILEFSEGRTEAEIQATRALIAGINSELQTLQLDIPQAQEGQQGGFLANLLGISDEELNAIKEAGNLALEQVRNLVDQRAELAAQNVENRTNELSRLNELLALEIQANQEGNASNIQALRERIAQEEAARQEALQQQAKAQRTQILLDTATQATNLVTASSNIFKTLSAIPFVGIPLAIAAVATMIGAFTASKVQALQATKLYTGGRIPLGGHDDRNGGKGHRVEGTNVVVGAGEWVINRKASDKHNTFLNALNGGAFDGVDLMSILEGSKAQDLNNLTIKVQKQKVAQSQAIQSQAIQSAIQKQTLSLGDKLNSILKAPSIQVTNDGYYKVINSNNSTTINHVKTWQEEKQQEPLSKKIAQRYKVKK